MSRPDRNDPERAGEWHALGATDAATRLGTDASRGLSSEDASARLERDGPNEITRRVSAGPLKRLLLQFHSALIYILLVAGAITLALGEWLDGGVILAVVVVNAAIGFAQESRALKAINSLRMQMSERALVIRAGKRVRVDARQLVRGDLVALEAGDRVPADLRLLEVNDLQIDESALTGESVPVAKSADPLAESTELADRVNMAYSSALVTRGRATGLVVATGDASEIGRISELIGSADQIATPLTRTIARFSTLLMWAILGVAALVFVMGLLRDQSVYDTFLGAVALAVAAIPEGLPAAITIMLAIGVSRMAKRKALIRKLPAVEALGSTSVICSDKTGTLTKNEMTVERLYAGGARYSVSGAGYEPRGEISRDGAAIDPDEHRALHECLVCAALCNDSSMRESDGRWSVEGDPTEGALVVVGAKAGLEPESLREDRTRLSAIAFESDRQYMATLHEHDAEGRVVYLKGALERVLDMCERGTDSSGEPTDLDADAIRDEAERMARDGLRVLAFATGDATGDTERLREEHVEKGLRFLGVIGMMDPPRPEAIDAVKICRDAGIAVKMITGDHATTAASIAAKIGLGPGKHKERADDDQPEVVTGSAMSKVDDDDLPALADETTVFARMTPEQKIRLVRALQSLGYVVAMTGDGVNDAPALRQADIGVAMGITGTEVAKDASDMVLADDNFASIEAAVEEGRTVYDNLTKFIAWTLPTNGGEALIVLTGVAIGGVLPITPVQVLYVNMTCAILIGLPLAFEPQERDIMSRPPRDPSDPLLSRALLMRTGLVSILIAGGAYTLFKLAILADRDAGEARSITVSVVIACEAAYLFNCRSLTHSVLHVGLFSNRYVWVGLGAMALVHGAYIYTPAMNRLFGSAPIGLADWAMILGVAAGVFAIVGFEKWVRRSFAARRAR